jgi:ribosomal-protein-alanine N-acetyltransferase
LEFKIRKASEKDLDLLYEIEVECFGDDAFAKPQLEYCLTFPSFLTLVAMDKGQPIGFITGSMERLNQELVGHLYTLDVKSDYRTKGLGTKLLNALEYAFAKQGVRTFYLEVSVNNVPAKNLYLKAGYRLQEKLKDYYEPGEDAIRLKKSLAPSQRRS